MNKYRTSKRGIRLSALVCVILLYAGGAAVICFWNASLPPPQPAPVAASAVTMSFARMELVAAPEAPPPDPIPEPPLEPKPEPPPEPPSEPPPEPTPPEDADVALDDIADDPAPVREPEPVPAEAQVSQNAAAPEAAVAPDVLLAWVSAQIEKEKYYPATAQRAGYEGTFQLLVKIDASGTVSGASVVSGKGHTLLRRALEKMIGTLPGRSFGQSLNKPVDLFFEFRFDLN